MGQWPAGGPEHSWLQPQDALILDHAAAADKANQNDEHHRSMRCTSSSTELIAFAITSHIYILFELYPFLTHNENLQVPASDIQLYFRANTICSLKIYLEIFLGEKKPNIFACIRAK